MRCIRSIASLCILVSSANVGCSTLTKSKTGAKDTGWSVSKLWKKDYQQPQQMAAIWSHDILASTGKPPTRGFGGRVYFYNERSQPIPVEGELIVHGFEEKPGILREYTTESDKRFRFTADQFTSHYSESELGASYSIWLPWDAADGVQREITLIPTFKSSKGQVVQGPPAKLVLPGKGSQTTGQQSPIQTVSYQDSQTPTVDGLLPNAASTRDGRLSKDAGMKTTTINLPAKTSQRLAVSNPYNEATGFTAQSSQVSNATIADPNAKVQAILDQLNALNHSPSSAGTQPEVSGQQHTQLTPGFSDSAPTNLQPLPVQPGPQTINPYGSTLQGPTSTGLPQAKQTKFGFQ